VIRPATLDDIPQMHRVRTSVRENVLGSPRVVTLDSYRGMLDARGRGWVAEWAGCIVGFSVADLETRSIWALFVHPDYERRGFGRQLLDCAVVWFRRQGVESIWLTTDAGTRAEGFYRAAAWQAVGVEPGGEIRFEL
jgi:GNAT superfamily N-acetyltransferase